MKRLMLEGPSWYGSFVQFGTDDNPDVAWIDASPRRLSKPFSFWGGRGGDEYGNRSLYFRCSLFGVIWFYGRHVQQDVELPNPGVNEWVDRVFYNMLDGEDI